MAHINHQRWSYYDIFVDYVLESSTNKDELRKWLQPNLREMGPEHEVFRDCSSSEFRLPEELTIPSLCERADAFYRDETFRRHSLCTGVRQSIWLCIVPALFVYLVRVIRGLLSVGILTSRNHLSTLDRH